MVAPRVHGRIVIVLVAAMALFMKQKSTGTRHTASAGSIGRSSARSGSATQARRHPYYAICINNNGNPASLMLGKAYRVIRPLQHDPAGMLRVIDEDAEDYLYDSRQFVPIELPARAKALLTAAERLQ
jgi:hypothetical protein